MSFIFLGAVFFLNHPDQFRGILLGCSPGSNSKSIAFVAAPCSMDELLLFTPPLLRLSAVGVGVGVGAGRFNSLPAGVLAVGVLLLAGSALVAAVAAGVGAGFGCCGR